MSPSTIICCVWRADAGRGRNIWGFRSNLGSPGFHRGHFRRAGPWNRSPGFIFVDLCSVSQAGALGHVPGPNFGRQPAQNQENLKYIFQCPFLSPSRTGAGAPRPARPHQHLEDMTGSAVPGATGVLRNKTPIETLWIYSVWGHVCHQAVESLIKTALKP